MIVSFKNQATEDIFDGLDSKAARKLCPTNLWSSARRKLDQLNTVTSKDELTIPPGNRLEALKGDRQGQHSIRINQRLGARSLAEVSSAGSHRNIEFVLPGHNREQGK
jgi:proteic killer suppression protein